MVVRDIQCRPVDFEEPQPVAVAVAFPCPLEHSGGAVGPDAEVDDAVVVKGAQQSAVAATDFQHPQRPAERGAGTRGAVGNPLPFVVADC